MTLHLLPLNTPIQTRIPTRRVSQPTRPARYYLREENFCQTCGAEWSGPAPKPRSDVAWTRKATWMLAGGIIALTLTWAFLGVIYS